MKNKKYVMLLLVTALATGCGAKEGSQTQETMTQSETTQDTTNESAPQEDVKTDEANNETPDAQETQTSDTSSSDATTADTTASDSTTTQTNASDDATTTPTDQSTQEQASQEATPVEQISLDGLSTESKGWGQGGNVDENNVPVGCTMYQEKYGHLGADFVRTDSDAVYLTFDEGYEYPEANSPTGNTAKILDTLKEKGVKGVFFVTLPYVKSNPDLVRRMIDEGHIVGNHSVNHPSKGLPSLGSVEAQQAELTGVHDYMLENYNYKMNLFRYPTGAFSEQSLAIVHNLGYKSVFWSFAYKDWITDAQPDKTEALNTMVEKLHPGAIYLLHGVSTTNTEVLGDFIDAIKAAGYEIKPYE